MSGWQDGHDCWADERKLLEQFRERISRRQVELHAEQILRQCIDDGGSCFTFRDSCEGLAGHAIRSLLVQHIEPRRITDGLVRALLSELGFTPEWTPVRLLVREALALSVRLRQTLRRLGEGLSGVEGLKEEMYRAASSLDSSQSALLLSDEEVDALIESIR
jgi:hypothetical protein